jgi:uncharacterized coiled-coil protein SlyX
VHQFHHHRRPDNFADDQMSRSQGVPDTGLDTRLGRVEQALDELNKHITDNDHKSRQLQKKVLRKFASSLKETEERLQEQVLSLSLLLSLCINPMHTHSLVYTCAHP